MPAISKAEPLYHSPRETGSTRWLVVVRSSIGSGLSVFAVDRVRVLARPWHGRDLTVVLDGCNKGRRIFTRSLNVERETFWYISASVGYAASTSARLAARSFPLRYHDPERIRRSILPRLRLEMRAEERWPYDFETCSMVASVRVFRAVASWTSAEPVFFDAKQKISAKRHLPSQWIFRIYLNIQGLESDTMLWDASLVN